MCILSSLRFFDGFYNCIDIIESDLESFKYVSTSLSHRELVSRSSSDHFSSMLDECLEYFLEIEESWLETTISQSNHVIREACLKWCEFVELVQYLFWKRISLHLHNDTNSFFVGFITDF